MPSPVCARGTSTTPPVGTSTHAWLENHLIAFPKPHRPINYTEKKDQIQWAKTPIQTKAISQFLIKIEKQRCNWEKSSLNRSMEGKWARSERRRGEREEEDERNRNAAEPIRKKGLWWRSRRRRAGEAAEGDEQFEQGASTPLETRGSIASSSSSSCVR